MPPDELEVPREAAGQRLDAWLARHGLQGIGSEECSQYFELLKNLAAMAVLVLWVALTMISVYTSYREIFNPGPAPVA